MEILDNLLSNAVNLKPSEEEILMKESECTDKCQIQLKQMEILSMNRAYQKILNSGNRLKRKY